MARKGAKSDCAEKFKEYPGLTEELLALRLIVPIDGDLATEGQGDVTQLWDFSSCICYPREFGWEWVESYWLFVGSNPACPACYGTWGGF